MLSKDTLIEVSNRGLCNVGYKVPDLGVRRQFAPNETKEISMEELRSLSYQPGGRTILEHYLIIHNQDAVAELLGTVEPEYNYTSKDVYDLLAYGTLDQLLDCLDFAPEGVIELIKDEAVKMELNDVRKREAILEKTNFNVTKAIQHNRESDTGEAPAAEKQSTRRAAPITETIEAPHRRAPQSYKVTSMG
ncbi:MAG: hypothetical protein LUC37_02855 [Prevotella sp.]|nr:hypothetical protein [Prevotella sp.]